MPSAIFYEPSYGEVTTLVSCRSNQELNHVSVVFEDLSKTIEYAEIHLSLKQANDLARALLLAAAQAV